MSLFTHPAVVLFMKPGMKLMRELKFPAKMTLMAVVLLLPLSWLTAQALWSAHGDLQATRTEAEGVPLIGLTLDVVVQTQKHRGLVNRSLAGDTAADAALADTRAALKSASQALNSRLLTQPGSGLLAPWQPIHRVLSQLADGDVPRDAAASFRLHSEQVSALRELLARSAESSGLLLEPESTPFHLMHLAVEPLVPWSESLGQLRGRGAALLRRGQIDPVEAGELVAQMRLLEHTSATAQQMVQALGRSGEAAPPGFAQALALSKSFADRTQALVATGSGGGHTADYFESGTQAIEAVVGVGRASSKRLQTLLDERAQRLQRIWLMALAAGIAAVFGVAYLTLVFFRTSFGAVRVLQGSVAQLAAGDFATRIRLRGTDELSVVGQSLDAMTGRISEMVSDIRSNSSIVAQAGSRLAEDTKALSERTESQASSLEQTSASVQEISAAVRRSAQGSEAAAQMAARMSRVAEQGGQSIQSAVASMQDIQASSKRVNDIVGVIEGIAFQTNILALNAAVEAARAGEQGRGFAVVASEVRSLAQRSSSSAREIKSLIGASSGHVETGVVQIAGASRTFEEIVAGIREMADSVRAIHTSTTEQSSGLAQIAQAVQHIDELTQQNAQMVDSALHSSSQLSERAAKLAQAVASFRLRQGSADEALALVHKGVQLYAAQGQAALATITDPASGLADRDMYVFAFDRQGIYRAFAGKPERVGTAVRDNPGVDGDKLVRDAFEQAARGGGWVDYDFANPQTGAVDLKTSYVEPVRDDLIVGCGIYKSRGSAAAGQAALHRGQRDEQKKHLVGVTKRAAAPA
ncbi:cache domain-containing protein [Rhizobacter sp. AJA081-3]|uniref:methyl-accepting chemotaxis protein n=1 Tax=Rhizobacter sp. AJA081-3 TaxID=2753607 RepID=UPI001AE07B45|nr:methyl-accepting chemotaxis protein [Rhizobacter sp. AJA081-3]QTN23533.1 cache domain-containing protein [Rhizobacter sp. AJA081-3]